MKNIRQLKNTQKRGDFFCQADKEEKAKKGKKIYSIAHANCFAQVKTL